MACSYNNWDFEKFLNKVLPHTIHLHISDASGIDGEGVEWAMGKFFLDYKKFWKNKRQSSIYTRGLARAQDKGQDFGKFAVP